MTKRIAILGGGISGLSAAYYLEKKSAEIGMPVEIELFEANKTLGGKIRTARESGLTLELGAESFLVRKPWAMELIQELGIADQLQSTNPMKRRTYVFRDGSLVQLPEGLSGFVPAKLSALWLNPLLSWSGKIRLAADLLLPGRVDGDEDESIANFITRRLGKQAYERMVEPLLCGIYCADGDKLSLQSTFPQLRELERKHGSLIRGLKSRSAATPKSSCDTAKFASPFATFKTGMSFLIESLEETLQATQIKLGQQVTQIQNSEVGWSVVCDGTCRSKNFDTVVVSLPSYTAAKILPESFGDLPRWLNQIPHASTALVNLWYVADRFSHPLDGYGFVVPAKEQQWMTAVTWTSSKHSNRAPDEFRLLRVYLGKAGNEIEDSMEDSMLVELAVRELNRTMSIRHEPYGYKIKRWPLGSPQYNLGHPGILQRITAELKNYSGLHLCGASYRGVGIPDCIRQAREVVGQIL